MEDWQGRLKKVLGDTVGLLRASAEAFARDRARRLSAGLAYYSIFALVPLLLTAMLIAGAFLGGQAAKGELADGLTDLLGASVANDIEDMMASVWETSSTSQFALISFGIVVFSASILFVAWRDALEQIWGVPYEVSLELTIKKRLFGMVAPVCIGLVLACVVILQTVMGFFQELARSDILNATLRVAGTAIPAFAALFAIAVAYRYSTRAGRPQWRDVVPGAVTAAVGLAIASEAYGLYLRFIGSTSAAGAASSLIVGLALVYYSAQILLFGAEVVKCSAERRSTS